MGKEKEKIDSLEECHEKGTYYKDVCSGFGNHDLGAAFARAVRGTYGVTLTEDDDREYYHPGIRTFLGELGYAFCKMARDKRGAAEFDYFCKQLLGINGHQLFLRARRNKNGNY